MTVKLHRYEKHFLIQKKLKMDTNNQDLSSQDNKSQKINGTHWFSNQLN